MANEIRPEGFEASTYWKSRDFKTSARLHLQHWLFQSTLDFVLHPTITSSLLSSESQRPLRVADLGCGNGAWLVDLCHTLSKDSTFYGFDIQPIHFPSPSYLPSNIHLLQQNVIDASIPADLEGSFDLVHIRAFGSSIRNSNASPILSAAHRLLKPGGWLQWDEADTSAMTAQSANTNAATGHQRCTALLQLLEAGGKATGTTSDWLGNLDKQFEGNGFEDVGVKKYGLRMEQYKAWTEDYLLVYEELAQYFPREAEVKAAPMTREKYEAFFDAVVAETNAGAVIHSQWLLCSVGKKRE